MGSERRLAILRLLALLVVIGISIAVYLLRDNAQELAKYGYIGIFLLSILANATIILPAPGFAIVFAMGSVLNPFAVAVAAGAGAAIGELTGYLAGFSGQAVVEDTRTYSRVYEWMHSNQSLSFLAIFGLAAVPNPFFDLAGIAAGALRFPVWQYLFWAFLGKTVKMLFFAYAGYYSFDLLKMLR